MIYHKLTRYKSIPLHLCIDGIVASIDEHFTILSKKYENLYIFADIAKSIPEYSLMYYTQSGFKNEYQTYVVSFI